MPNRRPGVKAPYKVEGRKKPWRLTYVDLDGKKHEPGFLRKIDAENEAKRIRAKLDQGREFNPHAGEIPFSEVWDTYLRGKAATVKRKTLLGYKSLGDSLILPAFGKRRVNAILKSDVAAWVADIQSGDGKVSSSRARQALIELSSSLDSAVDDHLIDQNPAVKVKRPRKGGKREGKSLTAEQLYAVADEMPTQMDRALVLTLGLVGLRWGEATALQVSSVDFDKLTMRVKRTYSAYGGGIHEDVPKNHEARTVPFPEVLVKELQPLVKDQPAHADVFLGPRGGVQQSSNWIRRTYRPALKSATYEDSKKQVHRWFSDKDADSRIIHDLRHTFASLAVRTGANVKVLQRAMGHADAKETLNTYADLFPDDLEQLGAAINHGVYTVSTEKREPLAS